MSEQPKRGRDPAQKLRSAELARVPLFVDKLGAIVPHGLAALDSSVPASAYRLIA